MYTITKKIIQYLGICLAVIVIVVAPNELRVWLDLLHDHIGPTALFITAFALISIQEYHSCTEDGCRKPMLKRSRQTAELCPAVGTLGTLIVVMQADEMNAGLVAHAINSTLYGLSYLVIFNFLARNKLAHLDDGALPAFSSTTVQQQPNQVLHASDPRQFEQPSHAPMPVNPPSSVLNNQQHDTTLQYPAQPHSPAPQNPDLQQKGFAPSQQLQFQ